MHLEDHPLTEAFERAIPQLLLSVSAQLQGSSRSDEVANILWSLSTLLNDLDAYSSAFPAEGGDSPGAPAAVRKAPLHLRASICGLLQAVATMEASEEYFQSVQTPDLISMLWGACTLSTLCQHAGQAPSSAAATQVNDAGAGLQPPPSAAAASQPLTSAAIPSQPFTAAADSSGRLSAEGVSLAGILDAWCRELAVRLGNTNNSGGQLVFQPEDLTDISTALAAVTQLKSPAMAQLLGALAHEAYRQVSNRHSLNSSFMPEDLVKLVTAYADLQFKEPPAGEMAWRSVF